MLPALLRGNSGRGVRRKGEQGERGLKATALLWFLAGLQQLPHTGPTCGGHSPEVISPAEHHAGPVAGALNQRPGQG